MIRFIVLRLIQTIIALLGISVLIFGLVRLSGDPVDLFRTPTSTPEQLDNIREQLGLDKSVPQQYWIFISNLVRGDLGYSYIKKRAVTTMIADALPNSLRLGITSFIISMLLSTFLGVLAATRRDSWIDNFVKFLAVLGQALPGFWLAIMSIWVFAVVLDVLPAYGTKGIAAYVLPVGTLSMFLLPGMMRLVRSGMLDVLDSEYVKLARIKGLPERIVIWKHALRNALIAPLTVAGMLFGLLIAGTVIIEQVFAWPGIGRLDYDAMIARDFPVVQGVTLMIAAIILLVNLLVDITYAFIDPQIRYQST
jgi:ABC-type dipeptide/oligopeptide/nickel transport system permease component